MPQSVRSHGPFLLLAALLAFGGCEWVCGKAHEVTEKIGERLISVELEKKLGAQMAAQLRGRVQMVSDPAVQSYVAELGNELVASAAGIPEGMEFHFQVIDAPNTVNAMAMPGGYIYVYSGLLQAADSEAELAGVLAHEIAHVAERHVVAQLITAFGVQVIRDLALGEGGQLTGIVTDFITQGALSAFSRTAEREADELGVRALARAGWDPRDYATFLDKLAAANGESDLVGDLMRTHPDPAERAERARELAAELGAAPERGSEESLQRIKTRLSR